MERFHIVLILFNPFILDPRYTFFSVPFQKMYSGLHTNNATKKILSMFLWRFIKKNFDSYCLYKWWKCQRKSGHLIFGLCPTTKDDGTICTHDKAIVDRQLKAWNLWTEHLSASNKLCISIIDRINNRSYNFLNLLGEQSFLWLWLVATFKKQKLPSPQHNPTLLTQ